MPEENDRPEGGNAREQRDQKPKKFKRRKEITIPVEDYQLLMKSVLNLQDEVKQLREQRNLATAQPADGETEALLKQVQQLPVEQREAAIASAFANMTPEQRAQREAAVRAAYAQLPPPPVADGKLRPGSIVITGKDNSGAPVFTKVRYRREDIDAMYPKVELFAMVECPGGVTIQGVNYQIEKGKKNIVPSIVAELYNNYLDNKIREENRYGPLMRDEKDRLDYLIAKGEKRVWTRVHQVGVGTLPPEQFPNMDATLPETQA